MSIRLLFKMKVNNTGDETKYEPKVAKMLAALILLNPYLYESYDFKQSPVWNKPYNSYILDCLSP